MGRTAAVDEETGSATFTAAVPATVRSVHFCYPYADGMALTDRDFDFPGEIVQAAAGRADGIFHLVSTEPAVFEEADVAGGTVDVNPVFEVVGSIVRLLVYSSDTEAQAEQVCKNLKAVVEAAGTTMDKVVKTTCFLADMNDFAAFNEVYGKYFTSKPARSCVAVKTLPKNVLCEVELIAEL